MENYPELQPILATGIEYLGAFRSTLGALSTANKVALIGTAVSLGFNVFNHRRTTKFRQKDFDQSQFDSIIAQPLEAAIVAFEELKITFRSLKMLDQFYVDPDARIERVAELQKNEINSATGKLELLLERADRDFRLSDKKWRDKIDLSDPVLDAINTLFERDADRTKIDGAIVSACNAIDNLCRVVRNAVMNERAIVSGVRSPLIRK